MQKKTKGNPKMYSLVQRKGYCCPYAYFKAKQDRSCGTLANSLLVNEKTIRRWRKRLACGECQCAGTSTCHRLPPTELP